MSINNISNCVQLISEARSILTAHEITINVGSDFNRYAHEINRDRPEQPIGRPFDPSMHFLTAKNGFWITGENKRGEVVHTQAFRLVDLAGENLATYLTDQFLQFPPASMPVNLAKSRYVPGPNAKRISGKTCYHGDLWIKPGEESLRGTGMVIALARMGIALSLLNWSYDFLFGFMMQSHAFRGLAERESYMHSEPNALYWRSRETDLDEIAFMTWMSAEDIAHSLEITELRALLPNRKVTPVLSVPEHHVPVAAQRKQRNINFS